MSSSLIVRSHLPGRIRFDAPLLRRLPAIAAALETDLSRCSEIILVRANGLTGSILVTFSPELGLTYVENTVRAVLLQQVEQVASVELVEAQESNRAKKSSLLRLLASTEPHRKLRRRESALHQRHPLEINQYVALKSALAPSGACYFKSIVHWLPPRAQCVAPIYI